MYQESSDQEAEKWVDKKELNFFCNFRMISSGLNLFLIILSPFLLPLLYRINWYSFRGIGQYSQGECYELRSDTNLPWKKRHKLKKYYETLY